MAEVLADIVLITHAAIVVFNAGSLPLIWIGWFRGWRFVRNFYFRATHLLLIGFVAAESALGIVCPLTAWETALRGGRTQGDEPGFIAHWIGKFLFYDLDPGVFVAAYVGFFLLVLATWFVVRPEKRRSVTAG